MKDKTASLIAIGIVQLVVYLLFGFVAGHIDAMEWHILWRCLYAMIFVGVTAVGFDKFLK